MVDDYSMEMHIEVFNAARDGKIEKLALLLESKSDSERTVVVNTKTNGTTPLMMACRNGHTKVVEYLVQICQSDVESVGSVNFDGETIEGAPPLWCAAAAGCLRVVEFLITRGAKVNNTTVTNSTPLRAACFDGHFEIVKYLVSHGADIEIANRHGHTCLMIACYKGHYKIVKYLIERGSEINRSSLKGNTALHDCAESGSLEIMKLLISNGAKMAKDCYGMTPLLAAAVTGHSRVVEYLIQREQCTKEEKIAALELLGATYVDKKRDMLGALAYWKRGMFERLKDPNNMIVKLTMEEPKPAYENAIEANTLQELDERISDPDEMRMQALLVRERILGPAHPDTSYYIRYRGAVYADLGNFERCITLWMYALVMQQTNLESLNLMTQSSFLSFAELFSFMSSESRNRKAHPIKIADVLAVYGKAVLELENGMRYLLEQGGTERDHQNFNRLLVIIMHLLSLISKQLKICNEQENFALKREVYRMVQLNARGAKGFTPLHLSSCKETSTVGKYPVCKFPSAEVAQLLIDVGASTTAVDEEGNTPLHIAATNRPCNKDIMRLLLAHGAHIDATNASNKTPEELLSDITICDIVCPINYTSLQCLAARKVKTCNIGYRGHVSPKLEEFLDIH